MNGRHVSAWAPKVFLLPFARGFQSGSKHGSALDMELLIADAVVKQLQNIRSMLASLGRVQKLEFRGRQPSATGPAEYYRVNFEKGGMSWMVNLRATGEINVLWSNGDVN